MGSPISPVVAEIVLQDLEISTIGMLSVQSFYYCFVDDIVLASFDTINDIKEFLIHCILGAVHHRNWYSWYFEFFRRGYNY